MGESAVIVKPEVAVMLRARRDIAVLSVILSAVCVSVCLSVCLSVRSAVTAHLQLHRLVQQQQ